MKAVKELTIGGVIVMTFAGAMVLSDNKSEKEAYFDGPVYHVRYIDTVISGHTLTYRDTIAEYPSAFDAEMISEIPADSIRMSVNHNIKIGGDEFERK